MALKHEIENLCRTHAIFHAGALSSRWTQSRQLARRNWRCRRRWCDRCSPMPRRARPPDASTPGGSIIAARSTARGRSGAATKSRSGKKFHCRTASTTTTRAIRIRRTTVVTGGIAAACRLPTPSRMAGYCFILRAPDRLRMCTSAARWSARTWGDTTNSYSTLRTPLRPRLQARVAFPSPCAAITPKTSSGRPPTLATSVSMVGSTVTCILRMCPRSLLNRFTSCHRSSPARFPIRRPRSR